MIVDEVLDYLNKNYTSDAPLFGHYVGTVWCPMHTKGTEYSGKVIKDYKI